MKKQIKKLMTKLKRKMPSVFAITASVLLLTAVASLVDSLLLESTSAVVGVLLGKHLALPLERKIKALIVR